MILLSGSNGLLGTVLKKYFNKNNIVYSTIGRKNCNFVGDIQNNSFVEKTIKTLEPNIFINLAAITDVDFVKQIDKFPTKLILNFHH